MNNNDFFQDPQPTAETPPETPDVTTPAPETFKIGETEYTKADLEHLVQRGEIARQAEEQYKTDITKVWPEYTKARQEIKALQEQLSAKEQAQLQAKQQAGEQLSPEEIQKQAIAEARQLGIVTKEDIAQYVMDVLAGQKLLTDIDGLVKDAAAKGIKTNTEDLLSYMNETGIKSPELALKIKYEKQFKTWEEEQLKKTKPQGLVTEVASTAGSKAPVTERVTRANLRGLISAKLNRGEA